MLGWHISVYRQGDGGRSAATWETEQGPRLAVWQTWLGGLDWIKALVKEQKAISLGGDGYPLRFTAEAKYLRDPILEGPPGANNVWSCGAHDILMPGWEGKTVKDLNGLIACDPDEWLIIEAWDES